MRYCRVGSHLCDPEVGTYSLTYSLMYSLTYCRIGSHLFAPRGLPRLRLRPVAYMGDCDDRRLRGHADAPAGDAAVHDGLRPDRRGVRGGVDLRRRRELRRELRWSFAGAAPELRRRSFSLVSLVKPMKNDQFHDRRSFTGAALEVASMSFACKTNKHDLAGASPKASLELRRSCAEAAPELRQRSFSLVLLVKPIKNDQIFDGFQHILKYF